MSNRKRIIGDDEARFWSYVDRRGDDECWPWTGCTDTKGYSEFKVNGILVGAHRWAYEHFVGPIPEGLTIDHVRANGCTMRHCVNWMRHLEPVTNRENVLRGDGPTSINARKTHCIRGHEFTPENTHQQGGSRSCRACRRDRERRYRARRRAVA